MVSRRPMYYRPAPGGRSGGGGRLLIALVMVAIALFSYFSSSVFNPVTGEDQHVSITPRQEIALGLQAVPEMMEQFGGLHPDQNLQDQVDEVGQRLVQNSAAKDTEWQFDFHLLRDPETLNAFALPGGQLFITAALYEKLTTEGQLAGVLAHEIGHVVARHGAQRIAKQELTEGLTGAVVVASGDARSAQLAALVGQMVNMKYGRDDELQSDRLGVRFMSETGYDPRSIIDVMQILAASRSGSEPPEFFSTHPNPENRIARIQEAIAEQFPNGVPEGLEK
jgi:beta-barrel assembly-enhancing protease